MERIFYSAGIQDEILGHPIYIFDTTYLPHQEEIDYDDLVAVLTDSLPRSPYVVVMFSGGLNRIGWIWGVKFVRSFLVDEFHVRNLSRLYTVHELWYLKSITRFFSNINSTKASLGALNRLVDVFSSPKSTILTRCSSIAELSNYMPVSKLKISLNVYKYDAELGSSQWAMRIVPLVNPLTTFDPINCARFYNHYYNLFSIISIYGPRAKAIFLKPGNKLCTDILYDCINRNQLIWINDWDLYCISGAFKRILQNMPFPLVDHHNIGLPMQDTLEYTQRSFDRLIALHNSEGHTGYAQVLLQLCDVGHSISERSEITLHTPSTIAKSLAHCVSQQPLSSQIKGPVQIVTRLLTNLISQWDSIRSNYNLPSIDDCLEGRINIPSELSLRETISSNENENEAGEFYNDAGEQDIDFDSRYEDQSRNEDQLGTVDESRSGDKSGVPHSSHHHKSKNENEISDEHTSTTRTAVPLIDAVPGTNAIVNIATPYSDIRSAIPLSLEKARASSNEYTGNDHLPPTLKPRTLSDDTKELFSHLVIDSASDNSSQASDVVLLPAPKSTKKPPEPHVAVQWPPQKYKFLIERKEPPPKPEIIAAEKHKPVTVRGHKVGELTRLFEERALGLEIIHGMQQLPFQ